MAELITGRGGTDHVDSEDFGAFNAVTLGDGTYILSGCSMTMKTATTLHIAAGELLMQGRHVRIKGAGEDVDVAVGTTGYNRNDIVALHYKQEGGIESVSVEVVAGTPTTGAASDPELGGGSILNGDSEAYAAIARVPIAGLAPSEPVVLVGGLKSNSQLAESVSALGDSVSKVQYYSTTLNSFTFTPKVSGVIIAQVWVCKTYGAWGGEIGLHIDVPSGLKEEASVSTAITGNDGVHRSMTAKVVLSGAVAGKSYDFSSSLDPNSGYALSTPRAWMLEVRPY
ncbi:MAG: hypothetical protein UEJ46_02055 [Eggerthellaceae bacterium]|nr:hypothetical protein [Eggerthellaceae bacterium]